MKTVFVITEYDWENSSVLGVFTTDVLARKFITDNKLEKHLDTIEIKEFPLDDLVCHKENRVVFKDECDCGCKNA